MGSVYRQIIKLQSLNKHFVRSLASYGRNKKHFYFDQERRNAKSKPLEKSKRNFEDNRRSYISNLFYNLLTKSTLKLERSGESGFEISAKDLGFACREQHSLYLSNDKFKIIKPIKSFGNHRVDVRMNMMDSLVPITVTVNRLIASPIKLIDMSQQNDNVKEEDMKTKEQGSKNLKKVNAV